MAPKATPAVPATKLRLVTSSCLMSSSQSGVVYEGRKKHRTPCSCGVEEPCRSACRFCQLSPSREAAISYSLGREPQVWVWPHSNRALNGRHQALTWNTQPAVAPADVAPVGALENERTACSWGSCPRLYDLAPLPMNSRASGAQKRLASNVGRTPFCLTRSFRAAILHNSNIGVDFRDRFRLTYAAPGPRPAWLSTLIRSALFLRCVEPRSTWVRHLGGPKRSR